MTDLEPGQIGLFILVGLLVLIIFSYLVSLIALVPPLRKEAQQNKSIRITLVLTLGFVVGVFALLAITRLETETSFESPPHGVVSGLWDDFEHMQGGALFMDEKTEEELIWDDMDLQYISRERFLRYMRPPFLRHSCFTGHTIACRWADIDLVNFDNKQEWIDFLIRLMIGISSGLVTGFMTWAHIKSKETIQPVKAG
jgi:hypothetical protein